MADEQHAAPLTVDMLATLRYALGRADDASDFRMPAFSMRRLLATLDAYRAIVAAVAAISDGIYSDEYCTFCGSLSGLGHEDTCLVNRSRALLGTTTETPAQEQAGE